MNNFLRESTPLEIKKLPVENKFLTGFKKRIHNKELKIAVVGLGYVGLPLAVEFAKKGFCVFGIEVDNDRINKIKNKESYITDIKTEELREVLLGRKFTATSDFRALREADAVLVCVPTPLKRKYHPNITYITGAIKSMRKNIKNKALVILESTTYPGTTDEVILPMMEQKGLKHGRDFYLCFSPERIDPGNTKYNLSQIPKVIGGINQDAVSLGALVYKIIIDKVVPVSSTRVAETVKLLENTFRLINIGLIDELAMMAYKMNIDIWEVIDAAKTKPFGFMPFYPGPGCGGHCIPKDPLYLYWKARKHHGFNSRFIKLASDIITSMPEYVTQRAIDLIEANSKGQNSLKILVIGATYKKDVRDLRKSPALDIIDIFQKKNIDVSYYDPLIPYLKLNHINLKSIEINADNLSKFDCAVIATDHSCIDYAYVLRNSKLIFDLRNVYKNVNDKKIVRL